jgi:ribosome-associated protein
VQLRFNLAATRALSGPVKHRLRALAGHRYTDEGSVLITARRHRTQEQNKRDALQRLADLIRDALVEPKKRRATKPTRASKERRLQTKRVTKERKRERSRSGWE